MEIIMYVILGLLLAAEIIIPPPISIALEKKSYNNGLCPICGTKLRLFDYDSQGSRGYCCDNCDYHTWISYNTVDKKR